MHLPVRNLFCLLVVIALGWLVWGIVRSDGQVNAPVGPVRWEYRVEESHMSRDLLNRCGKEGWELVDTVISGNEGGIVYQFVFKRPR